LLDNQKPLKPLETNVKEQIETKTGIKAAIFDIYGTLLMSASGDVGEWDHNVKNLQQTLIDAGYIIFDDIPSGAFDFMLADFRFTILEHHKVKKSEGVPYPEINIKEVWGDVLDRAIKKKWLAEGKAACRNQFVLTFELLSNQVYPMPGMADIIATFQKHNIPLGIVSNAQFYTPLIMNHYLKNEPSEEAIPPFDPDLTVFSFKVGKGKPDSYLYKSIIPNLKNKYRLEPQEALFIGNDMLNDVYAANKVGFKTALFAGDKRSLRWRKDRIGSLKPDYVITELQQLKRIITL
jgi:putative hydrolase of the HAD superfamily